MVNFAELKAKAEKAKDAGVAKVVNTKDRYSSISSSRTTWDPNWKRGAPGSSTSSPPLPPPPRPTGAQSRGVVNTDEPPPAPSRNSRPGSISPGDVTPKPPPVTPRASRPDVPSPTTSDASRLPPPPKRFFSGYPPSHKRADSYADTTVDRIDWTNLSAEDKEEFFRWMDEFFSRYLNVELGPRTPRVSSSPSLTETSARQSAARSGPPPVNTATRPDVF